MSMNYYKNVTNYQNTDILRTSATDKVLKYRLLLTVNVNIITNR